MSIYSVLQADAAVSDITDSIHIGQAPNDTQAPYIVLQFVFISPQNKLNESSGIDNQRISVDCYGTDQAQSINLYAAARAALEANNQIIGVNFYGERDPDIDVFRTQFDVSEWINR